MVRPSFFWYERGGPMRYTHCHECGGFISNRRRISYRLPSATTPRVGPHGAVCSCSASMLNGPLHGFASVPVMLNARRAPSSEGLPRPLFRKNFTI